MRELNRMEKIYKDYFIKAGFSEEKSHRLALEGFEKYGNEYRNEDFLADCIRETRKELGLIK